VLDDAEIELFAYWFHNDRDLPGGGTPAERYAARPDLPENERVAAARIATARFSIHRVLAVEPGRSLTVEDLDGRERVTSKGACEKGPGGGPFLW
jgi:hypothetical protein